MFCTDITSNISVQNIKKGAKHPGFNSTHLSSNFVLVYIDLMYLHVIQLVLINKFKSLEISFLEFKVWTNPVAKVNAPPFCINEFQQTAPF